MIHFNPEFTSLSITANKVYAEMGYKQIQPEEQVVMLTESLLKEILGIATPEYTFKLYRGNIEGDTVYLDEGSQLKVGTVLSSLMQGSESFAIFAATAGNTFQRYQEELKKGDDLLKSYVADAIGSCIAEETGDYMESMLKKEIGALRHTNRFSPGYCGWHLSEQKELFRLLGENPCGITLSDTCLMTPIKSISGIIGIGRNVKEKKYGCRYCELETCYKRRK
ncbi:MAG: hypothetical protein LBI82_08905 [Dysgonamonadaceae bacterium]|jgi:hypothetical protein|nr:hypothetical protein [Dysgonamonadaceae bacterium]